MLDKDKLILVFYLNVDHIHKNEWWDYLQEAKHSLASNLDDSVISYFIPVENENSKVDCINPKFIDEEEYKTSIEKFSKAQEKLEEFLKNIKF